MVKDARLRVARGDVGAVRRIVVEYFQGWMSALADEDTEEIPWRMKRSISGDSCTLADIGTHATHLARYVTGLEISRVLATTARFLPRNELEDDASVIIDCDTGARGTISVCQSATGARGDLRIVVYGDKAGLEWGSSNPGHLHLYSIDGGETIVHSATPNLDTFRLGGPIEAFSNLYAEAFRALRTRKNGDPAPIVDVPGIEDGLFGMQFVDRSLASAAAGSRWIDWTSGTTL
jgi:predicted dehydrogenase